MGTEHLTKGPYGTQGISDRRQLQAADRKRHQKFVAGPYMSVPLRCRPKKDGAYVVPICAGPGS